MIQHVFNRVLDCPVCGRPNAMQSRLVGRSNRCGHCLREFVLSESADDELERHVSTRREARARPNMQSDVHDDQPVAANSSTLRIEGIEPFCAHQFEAALLVEHRDDVFAEASESLARSGLNVLRARSAGEALVLYGACKPALLLANVDLPRESGWLLAAKLLPSNQELCIWLYKSNATEYDEGMAAFVQANQLIDYDDASALGCTIMKLVDDRFERHR